ncbi:MAG: hypothetical protein HGN29_17140 [Asgard group archaeon]|nr:hypothetical protein [Asgard group archaeon]
MKNRLLMPLIVVSVVGLLLGSSVGSVLIVKQRKYSQLSTTYDELAGDFEDQLALYETQLGLYEAIMANYESLLNEMELLSGTYQDLLNTYNILVSDNSDLLDEYDNLLADYNLLQNEYDYLLADYNSLVINYNSLFDSFISLQNSYDALTNDFNVLQSEYDDLYNLYLALESDYLTLESEYSLLQTEYDLLNANYNTLLNDYALLQNYADNLEIELNALKDYIRTLILPLQYSVFAEAVRRYYMPLYLNNQPTTKDFYMACTEYFRDVILHDSWQENSFQTVSNAFSDCLKYGSDTMSLADYIMYWTFWDWLPSWGIDIGYNLGYIPTILQWCIDEIDYEYDTDITDGQDSPSWDYLKFPVETAFRTLGDCDDQAMLASAYLESCGFETAITFIHDPAHPVYGSFYHAALLVHIEDTTEYYSSYSAPLWRLGSVDPYYDEGYTWCWLDPTWDIPFGDVVPWVDDYGGSMSLDIFSIAICDIDGAIV